MRPRITPTSQTIQALTKHRWRPRVYSQHHASTRHDCCQDCGAERLRVNRAWYYRQAGRQTTEPPPCLPPAAENHRRNHHQKQATI